MLRKLRRLVSQIQKREWDLFHSFFIVQRKEYFNFSLYFICQSVVKT